MCALYPMGTQVYLVEAAGQERSHPILTPLGFVEPEGRAVCVWSGPLLESTLWDEKKLRGKFVGPLLFFDTTKATGYVG